MAEVLSNFLNYFFPAVDTLPQPIQVLVGVVFLTLFFGLLLRILKR